MTGPGTTGALGLGLIDSVPAAVVAGAGAMAASGKLPLPKTVNNVLAMPYTDFAGAVIRGQGMVSTVGRNAVGGAIEGVAVDYILRNFPGVTAAIGQAPAVTPLLSAGSGAAGGIIGGVIARFI